MLIGLPVELAADLAVPIGMALHELTTNAIQYGALSVPAGSVQSGRTWLSESCRQKASSGMERVRWSTRE